MREFKMDTAQDPGALQSGSGKLGSVGSYSEEITKDGHISGSAQIAGEKDVIAAIPGALKVKGTAQLEVDLDPVAVILYEAEKINNPVAQWLAKELLAMRGGAAPSAAASAAAAQAAAPSTPSA